MAENIHILRVVMAALSLVDNPRISTPTHKQILVKHVLFLRIKYLF
jgi:hypothetical protein